MTEKAHNNKQTLIILLVVFVLPVILAYMALKMDWFNKAATNRGELLQPVIEAQALLADSDKKWHIIYVIPELCDAACTNALYSVKQTHAATGKEADRVSALFIYTDGSDKNAIEQVKQYNGSFLLQKSQENVDGVFKDVAINAIFISDTLHNIVLTYPTTQDKEQAIMDSRDVLADLKKLLKLSRIG